MLIADIGETEAAGPDYLVSDVTLGAQQSVELDTKEAATRRLFKSVMTVDRPPQRQRRLFNFERDADRRTDDPRKHSVPLKLFSRNFIVPYKSEISDMRSST